PFGDFDGQHGLATRLPWVAYEAHGRFIGMPFGDIGARGADVRGVAWRRAQAHDARAALPWGAYAAHALSLSALWQSVTARGGFVAMPWSPMAARSSRTVID